MKFIIPLISFLLGNAKGFFQAPRQALTEQVIMHARAVLNLAVVTIGSLVIACVGLSLLIAKTADLLDRPEGYEFTAGTGLYLVVTIIAITVLIWSLRRRTWLSAINASEKPVRSGSPIENAIALVVMDFLEERKNKRDPSQQ